MAPGTERVRGAYRVVKTLYTTIGDRWVQGENGDGLYYREKNFNGNAFKGNRKVAWQSDSDNPDIYTTIEDRWVKGEGGMAITIGRGGVVEWLQTASKGIEIWGWPVGVIQIIQIYTTIGDRWVQGEDGMVYTIGRGGVCE